LRAVKFPLAAEVILAVRAVLLATAETQRLLALAVVEWGRLTLAGQAGQSPQWGRTPQGSQEGWQTVGTVLVDTLTPAAQASPTACTGALAAVLLALVLVGAVAMGLSAAEGEEEEPVQLAGLAVMAVLG